MIARCNIMKKEDIGLLSQLLASMKDAVAKLEAAYKRKDAEMLASAKQEILQFQTDIKRLL